MARYNSLPTPTDESALNRESTRETPAWLRGVYALLCLYLFLTALNVISSGLGLFGDESDFLLRAFAYGENPFIALMGGVLVTAVVQSSSFTTSLIVTLVATGEMTLGTAVFAVMGANIGTSMTAVVVALANLRIRAHFRRSFTAALLHDLFNLLTVALLVPLEWASGAMDEQGQGVLTRTAAWISEAIGLEEVARPDSPVKVATAPIVDSLEWLGNALMPTAIAQGLFVAALGVLLMFAALGLMVRNLRGALLQNMDGLFRTYFFRNDLSSYGVGLAATVMVQSSTITTSVMVPLAGAGIVPMRRLLPFMMGSNLGTTMTTVIAATANPAAAALTVALVHVLFNVIGTAIWYPLQRVPIAIAGWYAELAGRAMRYAFLFLLLVFLIIPVLGIALTELLISG